MPCSASSACPLPTRTIPSAPSGRVCASSRTPRSSIRLAGHHCGCASGSTPGRRSCGSGSRQAPASASWRATRSTAPRASRRSPREMGVAVGLATYEATAAVFDYEELEPATPQGQGRSPSGSSTPRPPAPASAPISLGPTPAPSSAARSTSRCSRASSTRRVASSSVQLVTVVGEPGLGKSRIVAELAAYLDGRPELVTWRQGRCLPYGEGITFWALGEIVKAHAGILESDAPDGRHRQARRRPARGPRAAPGSASVCCRCSASRPPRRPSGRSCSPPGDGSSSRSRRTIRPSSSSRTSTGPMPR